MGAFVLLRVWTVRYVKHILIYLFDLHIILTKVNSDRFWNLGVTLQVYFKQILLSWTTRRIADTVIWLRKSIYELWELDRVATLPNDGK